MSAVAERPRNLDAAPEPFGVALDDFQIRLDDGTGIASIAGRARFIAHADGDFTLHSVWLVPFTNGPEVHFIERPAGRLDREIWDQISSRAVFDCLSEEDWERLDIDVPNPYRELRRGELRRVVAEADKVIRKHFAGTR
jgi:hypothetical protein